MPLINFKDATKLYHGNTQIQKAYLGNQLVYSQISNSDPHWNNVVLYLKGDNLTDSSNNTTLTISNRSNVTIDTAINKYGSGSLYYNGSNHLEFQSNSFVFGTQDFTIEGWFKSILDGNSNFGLFTFSTQLNNDYANVYVLGKELSFYSTSLRSASTTIVSYDGSNSGLWTHYAMVRSSNILNVYVNGVKKTNDIPFTASITENVIVLGKNQVDKRMTGHIDSFRVTKSARYTANFNPETDTYLAY